MPATYLPIHVCVVKQYQQYYITSKPGPKCIVSFSSSLTLGTKRELKKVEEDFKYDASILKTTLLGIDELNTLLSSVFLSFVENDKSLALLSLVLLCITTVIVFVLASFYFIKKACSCICSSESKCINKCLSVAAYASIAIGAILYYVGDNIVQLSI